MSVEINELEPQAREFFTNLKTHVIRTAGNKVGEYWFTMRELRYELNIPKTSCFRLVDDLLEQEYLERRGYANTGHSYRIVYWDDIYKNRKRMRDNINAQLEKLGVPPIMHPIGTPEPLLGKASTGSVPSAA